MLKAGAVLRNHPPRCKGCKGCKGWSTVPLPVIMSPGVMGSWRHGVDPPAAVPCRRGLSGLTKRVRLSAGTKGGSKCPHLPHWYKHPHTPVGKLAGGASRPHKANLINRTGGADGFLFATFSFAADWRTAGPLGYALSGRTFGCITLGTNPWTKTKGAPSHLFRHDPL